MDIIGNEVTQRIRAAITNKLKEVGVYVDDELPDYIMVMVANKKSKEQMTSDLQLFLGINTKSFTVWLHELLDNLQATTAVGCVTKPLAAVEAKERTLVSQDPDPEPPAEERAPPVRPPEPLEEENEEIITFQTELETDDVLMQELQKEDLLTEAEKKSAEKRISLQTPDVTDGSKSPERAPAYSKAAIKVRPIFHRKSPLHRPAKVYDSYFSNDEDEDGEDKYDPRNPSVNSVASVVRVSQRKSSVPPSLQANKLLLFKAMEDANKSVSHTKKRAQVQVEPYEPTPIAKLKKKPTLRFGSQELSREAMISLDGNVTGLEELGEDLLLPCLQDQDQEGQEGADGTKDICVPVSSTKVPLMPLKRRLNRDPLAPTEVIVRNPRFVVTLDGVDPSEFLSPRSLRSVVSQRGSSGDDKDLAEEEDSALLHYQEEEEEEREEDPIMDQEMEEDEEPAAKRGKTGVRCLKWPACPHGEACHFHHPKQHCKMFPGCSFGSKCLFIHPNCKYDSFCKKRDCPYTHAGKRKPSGSLPLGLKTETSASVVCKFHPDCLNPNCTFLHPKNCRFGLQCKNPGCQFTHPVTSVAPPHQLKWTAPKMSTSDRKFCMETSEHMAVHIEK